MTPDADLETLRGMVLHRQRLVAEAMAAAVEAASPGLVLETATSTAIARNALSRLQVLLSDASSVPTGVQWGSPDDPDSALYIALGDADGPDPVNQTLSALRAGASAWLPAEAAPELVLHVLQVVARGDMWVPLDVLGIVMQRLVASPRLAVDDLDLSPRERTVLDLVAAGQTNREIAALLHLSPNTVRTHRQRVFRKIDAHSAVQAAAWLRGSRTERAARPGPRLRSDQP